MNWKDFYSNSVISLTATVLDSRVVSILNIQECDKFFNKEVTNGIETWKDLTLQEIKDLLKRSPQLKVLEIQNLNQELIQAVTSFCPKLESLYFHSYDPDLVSFLNSLDNHNYHHPHQEGEETKEFSTPKRRKNFNPFLNHLKILACPFNISKNALQLFIRNLKNLETLIIEYAPEGSANNTICGQFQNFYTKIKHLILGNLGICDDTIFSFLPKHNLIELEMLYPIEEFILLEAIQLFNLHKLSINACYCSFSAIRKISELQQLESLEIERLDLPNDTLEETFKPIFMQCHRLKQFRVTGKLTASTD